MTHLTEAEFVDLLDATLAPSRESRLMAHLGACADCRAVAATMREALAHAATVEMPEPSPLFWEHFSARVRDGVQAVDAPESSRWFGWALDAPVKMKWTAAGALLTLVLVAGVWVAVWQTNAPAGSRRASGTTAATVADAGAGSDPDDARDLDAESPESDAAWALVRTVADDVSWDDAATDGLGVRPGSVEHAMATLTGAERSELVRLLRAETTPPGA